MEATQNRYQVGDSVAIPLFSGTILFPPRPWDDERCYAVKLNTEPLGIEPAFIAVPEIEIKPIN